MKIMNLFLFCSVHYSVTYLVRTGLFFRNFPTTPPERIEFPPGRVIDSKKLYEYIFPICYTVIYNMNTVHYKIRLIFKIFNIAL